VLPAGAGVILVANEVGKRHASAPRRRGGDPYWYGGDLGIE